MSNEQHESPIMKCQEPGGLILVQFKWESMKNQKKSEEHGRPIYDRSLKAYITIPGSKNQVTTQEIERHYWTPEGEEAPKPRINENLRMRFRDQLAAWEGGKAEELTGTPLKELVSLDVATIATLKDVGIYTIEALAGLSDGNLFMGARKWRDEAQAYLEKAEKGAPSAKLAAENERLTARVEDLERQLEELSKPKSKKKEAA